MYSLHMYRYVHTNSCSLFDASQVSRLDQVEWKNTSENTSVQPCNNTLFFSSWHHSHTHIYHTIASSSSQFIKRVRLSVLRNARHTVMIKISAVKVIFSKHSFGKGMQRGVRGVGRRRGNVPGSRCKGGWGWNVIAKRKGNTTVHPCFAIGVRRSVPPSIVFVSGFRRIPLNIFSPPMHGHSTLFVPTMNVGIEIARVGVSGFPTRFRFTEFLQRRFSRGHGENWTKIGCSNGIDGKDGKQQAWEGTKGH